MRNTLPILTLLAGFLSATTGFGDVILTQSGRLIEGTVSVSETAVIVKTADGPQIVTRVDVAYRAATKDDAYQYLAKHALSVAKKRKLIRWCLDNDLQARAIEQCDLLRQLAPGDEELAKLRAEALSVGETVAEATEASATPPERPHSLKGPTMRTYRRQVLPILRNSCASAGCHSPRATNGLAIRRDIYRADSAATLDEVLDHIDRLDPLNSRLLTFATKPHGGTSKPPLTGRSATGQYRVLAKWLVRAAAEADVPGEDNVAVVR